MIKYFSANVEDAVRIAVYEADDEDDIYSAVGLGAAEKEIEEADLPDDFTSWKRYTAYAVGDCIVKVMSADGA